MNNERQELNRLDDIRVALETPERNKSSSAEHGKTCLRRHEESGVRPSEAKAQIRVDDANTRRTCTRLMANRRKRAFDPLGTPLVFVH